MTSPPPPPLYAAILGFGTVGQGIFRILHDKAALLSRQLGGRQLVVVKVLVRDAARADRVVPADCGFDAARLLTDSIDDVFAAVPPGARLDVVFEAMVGEEPAHGYLSRALREGRCRCIVTANKAMFARHGAALRALAADLNNSSSGSGERHGVGFEACVAGGVPVVKTLGNIATVQSVRRVEGILNGTSNFILTRMRVAGASYTAALREAQEKGYAEADPHNDVSGMDAFYKIMLCAEIAFGRQPPWEAVEVVGIDAITDEQHAAARAAGKRYRHVATVERVAAEGEEGEGRIVASVRPVAVDAAHALFSVDDVQNAVAVHTDYLGCVTLTGPGAGMFPTASVMVEDYMTFL